jgi:hypothetical protein
MTGPAKDSDRRSSMFLSLHVGAGGRATCYSYPHRVPILLVRLGGIDLQPTSTTKTPPTSTSRLHPCC